MAEEKHDPFEGLKREIADFHGYDEYALECYRALSFYFAQRKRMPQPMAARTTCENFGHDAPRGMCLRCGLGVELGKAEDTKQKRVAERDAWLAKRGTAD